MNPILNSNFYFFYGTQGKRFALDGKGQKLRKKQLNLQTNMLGIIMYSTCACVSFDKEHQNK